MRTRMAAALFGLAATAAHGSSGTKPPPRPAVDVYAAEAAQRGRSTFRLPGSIWQPGSAFSDLARDLKASQVDDLVTIIVAERASAVSKGTVKTSRQSSAKYSVGSLFGKKSPKSALANLADASGQQALAGDGTTSRESTLTTTLTARVTDVLPNGYLVLEGVKTVAVNSETQVVTVRGIARPSDIAPGNLVRSDHLAQMEVRIHGKGVVGDAIRRPFFLYRLLLGLLPF